MHIARFASFQRKPDLRSRALSDQVMMHRRHAQQAWNRRPLVVHAAIAQNQKLEAFLDRL